MGCNKEADNRIATGNLEEGEYKLHNFTIKGLIMASRIMPLRFCTYISYFLVRQIDLENRQKINKACQQVGTQNILFQKEQVNQIFQQGALFLSLLKLSRLLVE
jgi:hypothetical protein